MTAPSSLAYAIKDAQDLIREGSTDRAAWILLSFIEEVLEEDNSLQLKTAHCPVFQDVSVLVDLLIRGQNSLSYSTCLNLLYKHRNLLQDSVVTRGFVTNSAIDRVADEITVNERPKGKPVSTNCKDDFEVRMRTKSCDSIFPHVHGEVILNQELLSTLKASATIERKVKGDMIVFRMTHAFTSLASRDDFHIRHDTHYSTLKSSTYISGSGTLHEHRTVISSCRYIKDGHEETGKRDFCNEFIYEFFYSNFGAVLMYERVSEQQVGSRNVFSNRHSHAPGQMAPGLSKEKRALVRRLAAEGEPSQTIIKSFGVSSAASKRRIQHAIRASGTHIHSRQSGQSLNILLEKVAIEVQSIAPDDQLFFRSIKYEDATLEPCVVMTCKSWLENSRLPIHYQDITWIATAKGNICLIVYVSRFEKSRSIRPIAIGTIHKETCESIETFLTFIYGVLGPEAGIDWRRNDTSADKSKFNIPTMDFFVADGLSGIDSIVHRVFGDRVIRVSCYFHIFQALRRWIKACGYSEKVLGYMEATLKLLSQTQNIAQFFYLWRVCREHILKLARSNDGSAPEWKDGEAIVKYFEDRFIKSVDSNRWCRALLDENCSSRRVDRSTVCESFIRAIKRILEQSGTFQSQFHVEKILTEKVFAQLWRNFRLPVMAPSISADQWNRANLLINLCADYHSNESDETMALRPAERFAYALLAGFYYAMPADKVPMKIDWDYGAGSNLIVNFRETNEFHLQTQGFVIISGPPMVLGVMPQDWYNCAHCTCQEFIDNCDKPCVHILALYLKLCRCKDQSEMAKITSGAANFQALIEKQTNIELTRPKGGYRYPSEISYGADFVSNYLIYTALKSKKPSESQRRLELIRSEKIKADSVIHEIIIKNGREWAPRRKLPCQYTTMLLRGMTDDCFRKQVLNYKLKALPAFNSPNAGLGKKLRVEADFPGQAVNHQLSKLKKQKLSNKKQGAQSAVQAVRESAANVFDLQAPKRRRRQ